MGWKQLFCPWSLELLLGTTGLKVTAKTGSTQRVPRVSGSPRPTLGDTPRWGLAYSRPRVCWPFTPENLIRTQMRAARLTRTCSDL